MGDPSWLRGPLGVVAALGVYGLAWALLVGDGWRWVKGKFKKEEEQA